VKKYILTFVVAGGIFAALTVLAASMGGGEAHLALAGGDTPTPTPTCQPPQLRQAATPTPPGVPWTSTPVPYATCNFAGDPAGDPKDGGQYVYETQPWWRADINNSGKIDSLDQLALAQCFNCFVDTTTPTNTPTATPTFTHTPTHTPTATATATPTAYAIRHLISDTKGGHDGTLCESGTWNPNGYDWEYGGRALNQTTSATEFTSWGTFQWVECGVDAPNTIVFVQNLEVYGLTSGGWVQVTAQNNPFNWCNDHYPDTYHQIDECTESGGGWLMPMGEQSIHWAEATDDVVSGDLCYIVLFEAKKSGAGNVMANSGLDWRSGDNSLGDSWFGAYRKLTTNWQTIGGSSCTQGQLSTHGLP